jgi:hypothetical protein
VAHVTIDALSFAARWSQSRALMTAPVDVDGGSFVRRLALPAALVPGAYTLHVTGAAVSGSIHRATLRAPREGVVRVHRPAAFRPARPCCCVCRERRTGFTRGSSSSPGQALRARWISGTRRVATVVVQDRRVVTVSLDIARPLRGPTLRCVLVVGPTIVSQVTIRVP